MKRITSMFLALCLLCAGLSAQAITGEEALGLTKGGLSSASIGGYPLLQRGSKDGDDEGAYVVMLQNRLLELGYLDGAADGAYGSQTESAVINFQVANDLTPTGMADSTMQTLLYSDSAVRAPERATTDNSIMQLQLCLVRWGFLDGRADGVMGEATETAVAEFKSYIAMNPSYAAYASPTPAPEATLAPGELPVVEDMPLDSGVTVNGQNGEVTEHVMDFVNGVYPFSLYQVTLQSGSTGFEVWRVQRRLHQLNYLYEPDGTYGKLTEYAIRYFQRKNGLKENGVANEETQLKLFGTSALAAEEYVFPYKIGVSLKEQKVYIYQWTGSDYSKELGSCKCSTGMAGYETPKGTYQSGGRCTSGEWYYFKQYNSYAKYATRIVGGVLFHSVLYNKNKKGPTNSSVNSLGRAVSHGCVRLPEVNAKWIFDNCPEGTTIVIY